MAEQPNEVIADEIEIIEAEEIGIRTIDNEVEEMVIYEEADAEDQIVDATLEVEEEIPVEPVKEDVKSEEVEEEKEEYDSPEASPLMFEGYKEGVYFEANCFGDCEIHEYCYICPEHDIKAEVFIDEEINPENGWVYTETCVVCGHCPVSKPVDDKFVNEFTQ